MQGSSENTTHSIIVIVIVIVIVIIVIVIIMVEMGAAVHGRLVWVHTGEGRAAKASEKIETLKKTQNLL